jgi:hypothetical protein
LWWFLGVADRTAFIKNVLEGYTTGIGILRAISQDIPDALF